MLMCIFNSQSCLCVWSIACVALCIRKCCLCFLFFSTCAQTTLKATTCRQLWLVFIINFSKLFVHLVNYASFIMHQRVRFVFVFFWKCAQTILKTRTCKHHMRWCAFSNYQSCLCVWSITYLHYVYATTVCVFIFLNMCTNKKHASTMWTNMHFQFLKVVCAFNQSHALHHAYASTVHVSTLIIICTNLKIQHYSIVWLKIA